VSWIAELTQREGSLPCARVRAPTEWSNPWARGTAKSTTTLCCLSSRVSAIVSPRRHVAGHRVRFPDVALVRVHRNLPALNAASYRRGSAGSACTAHVLAMSPVSSN
jgi:hypothetical protein